MTPDEVVMLGRKVDELGGKVEGVQIALERLVTQSEMRAEAEALALQNRAATCPQAKLLRDTSTDVNAVAGIVRVDSQRIDALEAWQEQHDSRMDVTKAKWSPLLWTTQNAKTVLIAVLIAYIIAKVID